MSWGYFADLRLTLPRHAWDELAHARPAEVVLRPGWSGFTDRALEEAFSSPLTGKESFAKVLQWDGYGREAVRRIVLDDDTVTIRVCLVMDKSLLELAFPLAALLHAARDHGGRGTFALVNDGTYAGESGTTLTLERGTIAITPVVNLWDHIEALGAELFGKLAEDESIDADAPALDPVTRQPVGKGKPAAQKAVAKQAVAKRPVAKQAVAKQAVAQKPVAQKPVAQKPVAQKPVAQKPVAKKPVAKKPVAKKPVAKKLVAKKPVAKKPVAKKPVAQKPVAKPPARRR
jgi:hypothetical protein